MGKQHLRVIFIVLSVTLTLFFLFFLGKITRKWGFVGYQYRWSDEIVERKGFLSEEKCVEFGDKWLEKQDSKDALFTCSLNPRAVKSTPGIDVADKVCEYGKEGFVRCRK